MNRKKIKKSIHYFCWLLGFTLCQSVVGNENLKFPEFSSPQALRNTFKSAWGYCNIYPYFKPVHSTLENEEVIFAEADNVKYQFDKSVIFNGDVSLISLGKQLQADQIIYNIPNERINANGRVYYANDDLMLSTGSARIYINEDQSQWHNLKFLIKSQGSRGKAHSATIKDNRSSHYQDIYFSTCSFNKPDWYLSASTMDINHENGIGEATHAWLKFKKIPILYSPYLQFPIDDRRMSGFLFPSFSINESEGFKLKTPYYLNLAPHYDATIAPYFIEKRGFMLDNEFRFLTQKHQGQLRFDYLYDDDLIKANRHFSMISSHSQLNKRLTADVSIKDVSDNNYFKDFGSDINDTGTLHLERYLNLNYRHTHWSLNGRFENFQTLDANLANANKPYRRLPQIIFDSRVQPDALEYFLKAEYVNFKHKTNLETQRLNINPGISLPTRKSYGFLLPRFSLRHTRYDFKNNTDSLQRTLPIFSLDSGLYFDRFSTWNNKSTLHTLEPRIYYLYVKPKEQQQFPIFDTSQFDFNFGQMFSEDRFTGADRVGDANQISFILTNRYLLQKTGRELLRFSMGEILFLDDRKVTLPNIPIQINRHSSTLFDMVSQITPKLQLRSTFQYNRQNNLSEKGMLQSQYLSDNQFLLNASYHYRKNEFEQTDLSFRWPMSHKWITMGRWNYALQTNESVESLLGIEYKNCCWTFRGLINRFKRDITATDKPDTGIMFQLELGGFGSIGDSIDKILSTNILGY